MRIHALVGLHYSDFVESKRGGLIGADNNPSRHVYQARIEAERELWQNVFKSSAK
jgi:hypothetical protein